MLVRPKITLEKHFEKLLQELTLLRIELEEALASKANAVSEAYSKGHEVGLREGWADCNEIY